MSIVSVEVGVVGGAGKEIGFAFLTSAGNVDNTRSERFALRTEAGLTLCEQDFDLAVRTVVAKGKLSPTLVENVVKLAMLNITVRPLAQTLRQALTTSCALQADAHLVSTLFRANKKATAQNKISALYLLDAVCRDARARLKKQGKQKEKKSDQEQDPVEGVDSQGTYSSFLTKVEQILPKFMLDCWENGPIEHRVSLKFHFLESAAIPSCCRLVDRKLTYDAMPGQGTQGARYLDESGYFRRPNATSSLE